MRGYSLISWPKFFTVAERCKERWAMHRVPMSAASAGSGGGGALQGVTRHTQWRKLGEGFIGVAWTLVCRETNLKVISLYICTYMSIKVWEEMCPIGKEREKTAFLFSVFCPDFCLSIWFSFVDVFMCHLYNIPMTAHTSAYALSKPKASSQSDG